jgi:hypothetical protein
MADVTGSLTANLVVSSSVVGGVTVFASTAAAMAITSTPVGLSTKVITDTFSVSDAYLAPQVIKFVDSVAFASALSYAVVEHEVEIADTIQFTDNMRKIVLESLSDTYGETDSFSIAAIVEAIADYFGVNDSFVALIENELSWSDAVGFSDTFGLRYRLELSDTVAFIDSMAAKIVQLLGIIDTFSLVDGFSYDYQITLSISDSDFGLSDSFLETFQKVLYWNDSVGFVGHLKLADETYLVWAMNPRTRGAYQLTYQLDINSFARAGGKNLVCASSGIYEVGGTDDDGAVIESYLRTGMENFHDSDRHFPGEKLKQLLEAYLVLTAEGETLLKVITTRRGEAVETWFKCREKPDVISKKRVSLSNSLRSVLFQFELKPLKGKPMKLKELEIIPMFLSRSI